MEKLIFGLLCGCLYAIGLLFDWTYKETSVYICIYACPVICVLCAFAGCFALGISTFWRRLWTSVNVTCFLLYISTTNMFWKHYGAVYDPFELCKQDLIELAAKHSMTYEEVNLYIYCNLFFSIILFHLSPYIIKFILKTKTRLYTCLALGCAMVIISVIINPYLETILTELYNSLLKTA